MVLMNEIECGRVFVDNAKENTIFCYFINLWALKVNDLWFALKDKGRFVCYVFFSLNVLWRCVFSEENL